MAIPSIDPLQISALLFDYGNTLVEFGERQVTFLNGALHDVLVDLYGPCDALHLKTVRDRQIVRPFANDYRENDNRELCTELVRQVYGVEPEEDHVERLIQVRGDSYLQAISLAEDVIPILTTLRERYRLAIVSNYPISAPVIEGIKLLGLEPYFETVVISADIGYVKPHPAPFQAALRQMNLPAEACAYIGDNWLADVQGAKRIGMKAIYTTQFVSYEKFEPKPGDHEPDGRIAHLRELLEMMEVG